MGSGPSRDPGAITAGSPLTFSIAVALTLPLLGALVGCRADLLGHLCLDHLMEDLLQERSEPVILKEPVHKLRVKGNLKWGPAFPLW